MGARRVNTKVHMRKLARLARKTLTKKDCKGKTNSTIPLTYCNTPVIKMVWCWFMDKQGRDRSQSPETGPSTYGNTLHEKDGISNH